MQKNEHPLDASALQPDVVTKEYHHIAFQSVREHLFRSEFNMRPDGTIGGGGTLAPGASKGIISILRF